MKIEAPQPTHLQKARRFFIRAEGAFEALKEVRLALKEDPSVDAILLKGDILAHLDKLAAAEKIYEKVLAIDPFDADALYGKASIHSYREDYKKAENFARLALTAAKRERPTKARLELFYDGLAIALLRQGKVAASKRVLNAGIKRTNGSILKGVRKWPEFNLKHTKKPKSKSKS